jgi:hypothetical protein
LTGNFLVKMLMLICCFFRFSVCLSISPPLLWLAGDHNRVSQNKSDLFPVLSMLVFWVVMPCRLVGDTNVSEKHTVSIFMTYKSTWRHNSEDQHRHLHRSLRRVVTQTTNEQNKSVLPLHRCTRLGLYLLIIGYSLFPLISGCFYIRFFRSYMYF